MALARRQFLGAAGAAIAVSAASPTARADAYPTQPVHLIVGLATGGGVDIVARLMGQWLSERLGQPLPLSKIGQEPAPISEPNSWRNRPPTATHFFKSQPQAQSTQRSSISCLLISSAILHPSQASAGLRLSWWSVRHFPPRRLEVRRLCESKSGQSQLCVLRYRHSAPRSWRVVQDRCWNQYGPRTVQRRGSRACGFARWASSGNVL